MLRVFITRQKPSARCFQFMDPILLRCSQMPPEGCLDRPCTMRRAVDLLLQLAITTSA
jgi:hypothetical protein